MSALDALRADVARLALGVLRARRRRDHDGLRVSRIGIILFCATGSLNLLAERVMAALFPVLFLAGRPAVARLAAAALLGIGTVKWGSAGGAMREYHQTVWAASRAFRLAQPQAFEGSLRQVLQLVCRYASAEPGCVSMRPMEP